MHLTLSVCLSSFHPSHSPTASTNSSGKGESGRRPSGADCSAPLRDFDEALAAKPIPTLPPLSHSTFGEGEYSLEAA